MGLMLYLLMYVYDMVGWLMLVVILGYMFIYVFGVMGGCGLNMVVGMFGNWIGVMDVWMVLG